MDRAMRAAMLGWLRSPDTWGWGAVMVTAVPVAAAWRWMAISARMPGEPSNPTWVRSMFRWRMPVSSSAPAMSRRLGAVI